MNRGVGERPIFLKSPQRHLEIKTVTRMSLPHSSIIEKSDAARVARQGRRKTGELAKASDGEIDPSEAAKSHSMRVAGLAASIADSPAAACPFFDPWDDPPPVAFPSGILPQQWEDTIFTLPSGMGWTVCMAVRSV